MQHQLSAFRWLSARRMATLFTCAVLLMSLSSFSLAQSGRRPPKQPKSPEPLPPKQEEPPVKSSSDQNSKPQIPVKVIWYLQSISISSIYPTIVQEGCLEQLKRSGAVKAIAERDLNRKQAIDIAKGSTDTYVLWYELDTDLSDGDPGRIGSVPPQYLKVRYEVFTPGTGKTKTAGHVYQRPRGPGGVPLPVPGTPASAEYSLRYCGREMADRLLDTLNLPHPSDRH